MTGQMKHTIFGFFVFGSDHGGKGKLLQCLPVLHPKLSNVFEDERKVTPTLSRSVNLYHPEE